MDLPVAVNMLHLEGEGGLGAACVAGASLQVGDNACDREAD